MIEREPFFFIYVPFSTHFTILEWTATGLGLFWAEVPLRPTRFYRSIFCLSVTENPRIFHMSIHDLQTFPPNLAVVTLQTFTISERFRQFYFSTKRSTLLLEKSRKINFLHSFFIEQNAKLLPFLLMPVD